ncbi:MAG: hypothetical protein HAW67_06115 [Endozoicomonadaceae bacterium]|nr:hypothetical protein [Endozoicomonadaceae bacterium]
MLNMRLGVTRYYSVIEKVIQKLAKLNRKCENAVDAEKSLILKLVVKYELALSVIETELANYKNNKISVIGKVFRCANGSSFHVLGLHGGAEPLRGVIYKADGAFDRVAYFSSNGVYSTHSAAGGYDVDLSSAIGVTEVMQRDSISTRDFPRKLQLSY